MKKNHFIYRATAALDEALREKQLRELFRDGIFETEAAEEISTLSNREIDRIHRINEIEKGKSTC